jgi:sterol desaturase/sphingolipid hydroxylase (fatty acid hydroxylase superfamily)
MHKPEQRFFADYPVFKYLARHHYLHHVHGNTNYNVVLPLADYVLGKVCKPSRADLRGMHRMGLGNRPPITAPARQPVAGGRR